MYLVEIMLLMHGSDIILQKNIILKSFPGQSVVFCCSAKFQ